MFNRFKTFCTSRSTVVVLILLLTASLTVAALVPQSRGRRLPADGAFSPYTELLGLDHVFSTWWFVGLSCAFVLSLFLSTFDQYLLTRRKLADVPAGAGDFERCRLPGGEVRAALERHGFRLLCERGSVSRYVKGRAGYWGNFYLHLGLVLTVAFSLVYVLTEHRVIIRVIEGEPLALRPGEYAEREGFFAKPLPLPVMVALEGLEPEFHANDAVKHVSSRLYLSRGNDRTNLRVGQSDKQNYNGLIVYQQNAFGLAFELEFSEEGARRFRKLVMLPMPLRRDAPSYGNTDLDTRRYFLKAKFYPNADMSGMVPHNPQLQLRLEERNRQVGEAVLLRGEKSRLGPYEVTLVGVRWWSDILFEGSRGMLGIFMGFAVLLWGGVLSFFIVPREVVLRGEGDAVDIRWRAIRFDHFYAEERDALLHACSLGPVSLSDETGTTELPNRE